MDFQLSEENVAWRERARAFATEVVRPVAAKLDAEVDPERAWSWELVEQLDAWGLRQAPLPATYGGSGTGYVTNTLILEELAAADLGTAVILAQHWKFAQIFHDLGTAGQRDRHLKRVAANRRGLFAGSFTEPKAGSDNIMPFDQPGAGMQTFAAKVDGGWRINGMKHYISNANRADTIICLARTDRDGPLTTSVTAFIVPFDKVRIGNVHDKRSEEHTSDSSH